MASLSNMARSGAVKKFDAFNVPLDALKVRPGFNPRDMRSAETRAHIKSIAQTLIDGGSVPPLEVVVEDDQSIFIVVGHCRREAYLLAKESGLDITSVACIPFKGDEVEQAAANITSNSGLALTPLETADAYKRLIDLGWSEEKVAQRSGKTPTHVHNLLVLSAADAAVRKMVRNGSVPVGEAIGTILKHGEKAGEFLQGKIDKAEAKEAAKDLPKAVKTKSPKRVFSDHSLELMGRLDAVYGDRVLASKDAEATFTITAGELRAVISAYRAAYVVQETEK